MKKRAILEQLDELRRAYSEDMANLDVRLIALNAVTERMAEIDELANKLSWLHERVDLLAIRLENMRGNVTLDDGAAKRLTYQVGQFAARLDRLEAPNTPPKPRRKRPQKPARTENGPAEGGEPTKP